MNTTIKIAAATALTLVGLTTAGPAFAEDCFNASRSSQGNTAAADHAGTWWSIPELLAVLGGLTDSQIAQVMPVIENDPRIPSGFTVFYNPAHPGELASKMAPARATNGHGIDHSDDYTTPVFAAIFGDVAAVLGG